MPVDNAANRQELIGYVVIEERLPEDFDIVRGTPLFLADDLESAEGFARCDAFVCEVRRV